MPNLWEFIIIAIATWRIVTFLQDEAGPFHVMVKIRKALGIVHDDNDVPCGWPDNLIGDLMKCHWCLSFWMGIVMYIIWRFVPLIPLVLAISSGSILLESIVRRLKDGNRNT